MSEMADKVDLLKSEISKRANQPIESFEVVPVVVDNWNDQLSPWPFCERKMKFAGQASKFMTELEQTRLSELLAPFEKAAEPPVVSIGGYSLAGLFSIWYASQVQRFSGVASCSGSLWFPGFETSWRDQSTKTLQLPNTKRVYLSVGDKESKAKMPSMRRVEEITRDYADLLSKSGRFEKVVFELNVGGHFEQPLERMAQGFANLLGE